MSLRILFADDSMTAQNMGKKILTEAGYDVVAVSNGAAAVKKIAEQKPDIIILDVYMPGYSGLEVCEKVRASMDTLKTPVLLTVGKMEPYKAEDANRVRADGVIIKPFEASDLLAIVKRFEERIGQNAASAEQTVLLQRSNEDGASAAPAEAPVEHSEAVVGPTSQPMLEVPDHMATSAAFSDLLGGDASRVLDPVIPPPITPAPFSAAAAPARAATPEYEVPVGWQEPEPSVAALPSQPAPIAVAEVPVSEAHAEAVGSVANAIKIPVFQEPEPAPAPESKSYEVLPTAAPPVADIEIAREPELQETDEETTRNTAAEAREPGLMPTIELPAEPAPVVVAAQTAPVASIPTFNEAQHAHEIVVTPAPEASAESSFAAEAPATQTEVSDADFEARVAAAMAAYNQLPESDARAQAPPEAVSASASSGFDVYEQPVEAETRPPEVAKATETIPSFEYTPAATPQHEEPQPPSGVSQAMEPDVLEGISGISPVEVKPDIEEPLQLEGSAPQSSHAEEPQAAAAKGDDDSHHQSIAQAVHRVMERLKPELVEEILRELKSKK